ncbi:MAG: hypothetical protein EZS28_031290 [Streblomastix strix]|uniref:Uncharacterized protein n=1 Tax=Streblomastix strix TaxID=222440 RepID=A0A5J4US62_9EUKA|nr:MAG: hypothetical protein EZS28_031290 [Streblomastix strix]
MMVDLMVNVFSRKKNVHEISLMKGSKQEEEDAIVTYYVNQSEEFSGPFSDGSGIIESVGSGTDGSISVYQQIDSPLGSSTSRHGQLEVD